MIVAHSLGGLIATTYARTYPDGVVGLVLVDPASQFMEQTMGPSAWDQYVQAALSRAATGAETIDPDASNRAVNALPPLPPIPVVVLSSDQPWFILPFGDNGAMVDYSSAVAGVPDASRDVPRRHPHHTDEQRARHLHRERPAREPTDLRRDRSWHAPLRIPPR